MTEPDENSQNELAPEADLEGKVETEDISANDLEPSMDEAQPPTINQNNTMPIAKKSYFSDLGTKVSNFYKRNKRSVAIYGGAAVLGTVLGLNKIGCNNKTQAPNEQLSSKRKVVLKINAEYDAVTAKEAQIKNHAWGATQKFYQVTPGSKEHLDILKKFSEFNQEYNKDITVQKTSDSDIGYVKDGVYQKGQDGIAPDITLDGKTYLFPKTEHKTVTITDTVNVDPKGNYIDKDGKPVNKDYFKSKVNQEIDNSNKDAYEINNIKLGKVTETPVQTKKPTQTNVQEKTSQSDNIKNGVKPIPSIQENNGQKYGTKIDDAIQQPKYHAQNNNEKVYGAKVFSINSQPHPAQKFGYAAQPDATFVSQKTSWQKDGPKVSGINSQQHAVQKLDEITLAPANLGHVSSSVTTSNLNPGVTHDATKDLNYLLNMNHRDYHLLNGKIAGIVSYANDNDEALRLISQTMDIKINSGIELEKIVNSYKANIGYGIMKNAA